MSLRIFLPVSLFLLSVLAWTPARMAAAQVPGTAAPAGAASETIDAEDRAARATFDLVCGACHEAAIATTTRRTPRQWDELFEMMVSFGATATDAQFAQIQRFLNRRYGRVNVNRASAEELALVLELTSAQAQAVVAYRTTMRLTSAEDLRNVAGITAEKVESVKERLQF